MYYFSQQTIINAIELLKNNIPSKFIGLLSILRSINTDGLKTNETYEIKDSSIGDWLNDTMLLEETVSGGLGSSLFVRFANGWSDYVSDTMLPTNPKLYALIVFIYKFKAFIEKPTNESLLKLFAEDFHLSAGNVDDWFDKSAIQMDFSENCVKRSALKSALHLVNSTLTFESGYSVKAKASELSRAPFIQTLYAGMDSMKCLLISRTDLEYLYPSKTKCSKQSENLISRQIIYYGAPGTGKSHRIKEQLEGVSKENIFRTTFHPDSDYSTFVGAYKPTRGKRPLYGLNGGLTVRLNDGEDLSEDTITYKFVPQAFLNAYMQAYERPDDIVYLIIEEINRGNCAQIFGDLFQLLDRDENGVSEYTIKADADLRAFLEEELGKDSDGIKDGELCLPSNLYIYATMNTSDQSLFPIDSAFKRRWDWEYEPIKYKNTSWVIDIQGNRYSWVSFQKEINKRILEATSSEDKMLGDYFVNPGDGTITEKMLLNKILFYLWNDVCKDEEGDIFKISETEAVSFSELYGNGGAQKLIAMMEYLDVSKFENSEEDIDDDDDTEIENGGTGKDRTRYTINGVGKYAKKNLAAELIKLYIAQNPALSASKVVEKWKSLGKFVSHFVETQEEYDTRTDKEPRVIILQCNNENIYVSTNGWGGQGIMDNLINAIPESWNLKVEKIQ